MLLSPSRRLVGVCLVGLVLLAGCGTGSSKGASGGKLAVVAAEDHWGSIASQLGGDRVQVDSLISNPDTDPHSYEPTAGDARAVASARLVITNGVGYDTWTDKLLAANPSAGRSVLNVGDLVGLKDGDNPHRWYSPTDVQTVIDKITATYKQLDPRDAAYFDSQRATFEAVGLAAYKAAIADIKAKYAGTPIGASESIVAPLAEALGLRLLTPSTFLTAISEGNDPTAADKTVADEQISSKTIKVFVFNSQNSTPDVQRLVDAAKAHGIPIATVTETLTPRGSSFQDWQTRQLRAIEAALAAALGR